MASLILYVLALVLAVNTANSLVCYSCDSKYDTRCSRALDLAGMDCADVNSFSNPLMTYKCYKMTAKNKDGSEYITRGCTNEPAGGCNDLASTVGRLSSLSSSDPQTVSNIRCDTCETDRCNSATRITGFTLLGLLLAACASLL